MGALEERAGSFRFVDVDSISSEGRLGGTRVSVEGALSDLELVHSPYKKEEIA